MNHIDYLEKLLKKLDNIIELLEEFKSRTENDVANNILVDPSIGTCPSCGSTKVLQERSEERVVYKCSQCRTVWVNDQNQFISE